MSALPEKALKINDILKDFPPGPLTEYRNQASFDWKKLKLSIEGEDCILFKHKIWRFLENNPIFHDSPVTLPLNEWRLLTVRRYKILKQHNFLPYPSAFLNPKFNSVWHESLALYNIDVAGRLGLMNVFFMYTIRNLGTEKHLKFIKQAENDEIIGCFALTEVSHGSNAKGIKTTATHDPKSNEFIIHSEDFASAKCWIGGLGQTSTHVIVFAKLITSDGHNHGLHQFIVPIRCNRTLKPFPGVIIGDMGEKIALNGVDNGFVIFQNYRISKDSLLNRYSDVDDNGSYFSQFDDSNERFGAILVTLSTGRVHITGLAAIYLQKAIVIAIRYSGIRKQFGPENSDELSVLEYQQQQFRLIPYIAVTYAIRIFYAWLSEAHTTSLMENLSGERTTNAAELAMEFHVLSSATKPLAAWVAQKGIHVCREACGGHGYLLAAGIARLYESNDGNCTYEGENSLLIQQTSNWLLKLSKYLKMGNKIKMPLNTANYLNDYEDILNRKGSINSLQQASDPRGILDAYKWLVCYMLKLTIEKEEMLTNEGFNKFTVKNNIQSYHAVTLSLVYGEHAILNYFYNFVLQLNDNDCKNVMLKLVSLYGVWSLENHLSTLYMGGYLSGDSGHYIRECVIELCSNLKSEAVALVDAISPPDFILNSVLGNSNGYAYENLQSAFFSYPGSLSRPNWWAEVLKWNTSVNSKL